MGRQLKFGLAALLATLALVGCANRQDPAEQDDDASQVGVQGAVDAVRLARAAVQPEQWFTSGRDGGGSYFSPLRQINDQTVSRLGFAWEYKLGTRRGLEGTPIVIDGVMYASGNWGRVYAIDAATGRELWTFIPKIDGQWGRYACCDVVNRGLAVWQGQVYVGSLDGWLYALDAANGKVMWKVDTFLGRDRRTPYSLTGAPYIAGNLVVVGNGGADFGVRGYVSAYDLKTGKLAWRFFTVPRDPALGGQEQEHLTRAAETWDPASDWQRGGGGTVWDGMAYDPALKLLFIGTGNGSPYRWKERSPKGGDNLYLASIVAIRVDDGQMAWYYQQVPGESWDYTATAKMILADLEIDGRPRKVLMQAPKNGFFYVLDRATGELLSARNFTYVNWTLGVDPKTGRPRPNPAADYTASPKLVFPSQAGAHNWQPMSFSPVTGLVYIPVIDAPMVYVESSQRPAGLIEGMFTVPGVPAEAYDPQAMASLFGPLPSLASLSSGIDAPVRSRGELRAWDPVNQRSVWSTPSLGVWDGGVMSTAGNLVFQGNGAGSFRIFAADTGRVLHEIDVGTSIMAAPMTYSVDGVQYVAVMAGYGGGGGFSFPPDSAAYRYGNEGRIVVFKLGGGNVPKPAIVQEVSFPVPPPRATDPAAAVRGEVLYNRYCSRCHQFGRGLLPDLRRMSPQTHTLFSEIVLRGAYLPKGMARWDDVLSPPDAEAIHAFIIEQAWRAHDAEQATKQ